MNKEVGEMMPIVLQPQNPSHQMNSSNDDDDNNEMDRDETWLYFIVLWST